MKSASVESRAIDSTRRAAPDRQHPIMESRRSELRIANSFRLGFALVDNHRPLAARTQRCGRRRRERHERVALSKSHATQWKHNRWAVLAVDERPGSLR